MPKNQQPTLFVVDGSNIATEGRSKPSLEQLNEAVLAFMDENPNVEITVVVDATFGHRISKKETEAFDDAVANNELVTPPAGAIGRGDAFVLSIANKADAGVLSNDSFQEFHGDYDWLFDEGRLIGGKPVPHVGWVFVSRTPVRGPKSRRSVKEAQDADRTESKQTANRRVRKKSAAAEPEREQSSGGRGRGRRKAAAQPKDTTSETSTESSAAAPSDASSGSSGSSSSSKDHINELMPFLEFVEQHPVGTSVTAEVESYASHGAYARNGDVLIYLPLRLLDDPPPRSARKALTIGDTMAVVIVGFTPDRRSIDAALPHMAADQLDGVEITEAPDSPADEQPEPEKPVAKKSRAKTSAAKKRASKTTAAKKTPAKKTPAKKAATKKAATKKAATKSTTAKRTPAKKSPAKTSTAKTSTAKKTAAKKATAKKTTAKKAAARKTPAKKSTARKTAAKKSTAKKTAAKQSSAKKPTKKAAAKRSSGNS